MHHRQSVRLRADVWAEQLMLWQFCRRRISLAAGNVVDVKNNAKIEQEMSIETLLLQISHLKRNASVLVDSINQFAYNIWLQFYELIRNYDRMHFRLKFSFSPYYIGDGWHPLIRCLMLMCSIRSVRIKRFVVPLLRTKIKCNFRNEKELCAVHVRRRRQLAAAYGNVAWTIRMQIYWRHCPSSHIHFNFELNGCGMATRRNDTFLFHFDSLRSICIGI